MDKNAQNNSKAVEDTVNKLSQTAMGRNMIPNYIDEQYRKGNITADDVRKLIKK